MKVALSFPGCHRRGGVERVVLEMARFLHGRGHAVTLLANEWDEDAEKVAEVQPIAIARQPWFWRGHFYLRNATRALEQQRSRFDVVSTHGVICPFDGVHFVHSVHRAWLERSRTLRAPFSLARIRQRLNPLHPMLLRLEARHFGERRYKKLIALTQDVQADLMRYYGVPEADIVIVPNSFDPAEFNVGKARSTRDELRRKLGFADDARVIIFVANELERKGFGPLVRALGRIDDRRVHLLAVGRLDSRAYEQEIRQTGLSERVRFAGPAADVATFYGAADYFALPTQYEAWGLVIVEALACGLPVLTSRLAGAAVAVREGETGELLDDPQDVAAIEEKLRILLARRGPSPAEISASVAEYQVNAVLGRFEEVLLECARPAFRVPVPAAW